MTLALPASHTTQPHCTMRSLLLLTALSLSFSATAQDAQPIVGTAPFYRAPAVSPETASQLQAMVTSTLFDAGRFVVVEIENLAALDAELYEQGDEAYMSGVVTAVKPMGAEYLLFGRITNADVNEKREGGTRTYSARIAYDLRKVSVGTREVECQVQVRTDVGAKAKSAGRDVASRWLKKTLGGEAGDLASAALDADTPEGAYAAAINDTRPQVEAFLKTCFPTTFEVLAVEQEGADGRVEEVLISAGEEWGLNAGDALEIVEQQRFELSDGTVRVREVPVASLTVKEVQGEGFSVCAVPGAEDQEKLREALSGENALVVKTAG